MADYHNWNAVPVQEQQGITNLLNQWNALIGFGWTTPNWALTEMVNRGINSLFSMGQYMQQHMGSGKGAYFVPQHTAAAQMAWAGAGLTQDQYMSGFSSYQQLMLQETGTSGSLQDYNNVLHSMNGDLNTGLLTEHITQSAQNRDTYGWLKYGMTYDQFLAQKNTMQQGVGHSLNDQQAVNQLNYERGIGANASAAAAPTFTQQEKLQAQKGAAASGSAIR